MNTSEIQHFLRDFAEQRDWGKFHSAKNLSMALAGEAGELLELFQWLTEAESNAIAADPKKKAAVSEEIADVIIYALRIADILGIEPEKAVWDKLRLNAAKYPVAAAKGHARKYTELGNP
jgi:NTP pyrophosphatase (non-canonical NTP hydrolase)